MDEEIVKEILWIEDDVTKSNFKKILWVGDDDKLRSNGKIQLGNIFWLGSNSIVEDILIQK